MIVIWKGWGILAPAIAAGGACLGGVSNDWIYGSGAAIHIWPFAVGLLLAAALNAVAGRLLNSPHRHERPVHTLFWIPMEYYSLVMAVAAGMLLVMW